METAPGKIRINTLEDNIILLVSYFQVEMPGIVQDWLSWKADKAVTKSQYKIVLWNQRGFWVKK